MIETIVSLETAKLLKEKGFVNGSQAFYNANNGVFYVQKSVYINGLDEEFIEAPTQSLAQQWIREKGIHIGVYANASGWGWILTKCGGNGSCIKEIEDDTFFDTYEDALEEGLKQALKLI